MLCRSCVRPYNDYFSSQSKASFGPKSSFPTQIGVHEFGHNKSCFLVFDTNSENNQNEETDRWGFQKLSGQRTVCVCLNLAVLVPLIEVLSWIEVATIRSPGWGHYSGAKTPAAFAINNHQHKEPNTGLSFPRLLQLLNCIECEDKRRSPCIHSLLYLSVKRKPQKLLKLNKSLWGYSGSMKMYLSVIMGNYLLMQMFLKAEM